MMNLLCRVLWVLFRWHRPLPHIDPLAPIILPLRVMPNDLDIFWHVNNGRYLSIMDLGRLQLMLALGLIAPLRKRGWLPLLGSVKIHYLRPLTVFESFNLSTQMLYWDEKWIYMEQKFFKGETLCAVALLKVLFITKKGDKILPQQLLDLLPTPPPPPPIPARIAHWQAAEIASRSAGSSDK